MFYIIIIPSCMFYLITASNETNSGDDVKSMNGKLSTCFKDNIPDKYYNKILESHNPSSSCPPTTDNGAQPPFKYPVAYSRRMLYSGGWSRLLTVEDLPISTQMAGVQTRIYRGGIRELHWHISSEWGYVIYGEARITMMDSQGRGFVDNVKAGDIWLFPPGLPHSIRGEGKDGILYVIVLDRAEITRHDPFFLTDWMIHIPQEVLAKTFQVPKSTFVNLPPKTLSIFRGQLPQPLEDERMQVSKVTGYVNQPYTFHSSLMKPNVSRRGGQAKIVDANNFPVTTIAAAIVTLKPGSLREPHWHPNADEWQYYVKGKARMGVFTAGGEARTMDFEAGDVGYVPKSFGHYIENTCEEDVVFLEVFPTSNYEDISLAQWLAHTPPFLVNQHIRTGLSFINQINKNKSVILP